MERKSLHSVPFHELWVSGFLAADFLMRLQLGGCTALELCRNAGFHFSKLPVRPCHRKILVEDGCRLGVERKCGRAEGVNDGFEGDDLENYV